MSYRLLLAVVLFLWVTVSSNLAQQRTGSIPPNYSYYNLNPEYNPNAVLGYAEKPIEEKLGRGMIAVPLADGGVYLGWRFLNSDPPEVAFNLYRRAASGALEKINEQPILQTTDFVDRTVDLSQPNEWVLRAITNGRETDTGSVKLPAYPPVRDYFSFKIRDDIDARSIDRIGVGDLDGDGEYDFVVKRPAGVVDPGPWKPSPDTFKIEAYLRDGTFLWRRDLGWSIELGIWYSPMVVWDLDGDGVAEIALKTGEGDPRDASGHVFTGPEYLSVWNGKTGREIARTSWIPRGRPEDWGDYSGNRMSRNMVAIAYLDGKTPSVVAVRGIYGLMKMQSWFLKAGKLEHAWSWSNQTSGWMYQGQGQHWVHTGDIDSDGFDEILNGSIAVDQDGRILWSTGLGHGDRFYLTDVDPNRPGLEVLYIYEDPHPHHGFSLWEAKTGHLIWGIHKETKDNELAHALVADIDPEEPGMECWTNGSYYSATGKDLGPEIPPLGAVVWWDGDLLRELLVKGRIFKWRGQTLKSDLEGRVMLIADILGDWREEIVTFRAGEIRIYTTTIPAKDRRVCLMQDPIYRRDVAHRTMGYGHAHPPMTSYYLGTR